MNLSSPQHFNGLAARYASSEVHSSSPTLNPLNAILPRVESVRDLSSGAGHTGLGLGGSASRLVAVAPAPSMLAQSQPLAAKRGVAWETVEACAESMPLVSESFDLVTCRLAAPHFADLPKTIPERTRPAKQRVGPQKAQAPPGFFLIRSHAAQEPGNNNDGNRAGSFGQGLPNSFVTDRVGRRHIRALPLAKIPTRTGHLYLFRTPNHWGSAWAAFSLPGCPVFSVLDTDIQVNRRSADPVMVVVGHPPADAHPPSHDSCLSKN